MKNDERWKSTYVLYFLAVADQNAGIMIHEREKREEVARPRACLKKLLARLGSSPTGDPGLQTLRAQAVGWSGIADAPRAGGPSGRASRLQAG